MTTSNELMEKIQALQYEATQREDEIERAKTAKAKANVQLDILSQKLQEEFGIDWSEIETYLKKLQSEADAATKAAEVAFIQAGIE